jgi:hypothetical protein
MQINIRRYEHPVQQFTESHSRKLKTCKVTDVFLNNVEALESIHGALLGKLLE